MGNYQIYPFWNVSKLFDFKPLDAQNCIFNTMSVWRQIAEYLYIKKPDPDRPKSQWIKYMHGINRLSIFLFILALIILAIKLFVKK